MRKKLLPIIACPHCKGELELQIFKQNLEETENGLLLCKCGRKFPIIKGVPRLLPDSLKKYVIKTHYPEFVGTYPACLCENVQRIREDRETTDLKKRTLKSFGYEWKRFSQLYAKYEQQFLDWIYPVSQEFFKDKLVLDAGCGAGRHIYYSTKFGAETVGIDISEAVDVAYGNVKHLNRAHIIQADIFYPPFKNNTFDYSYSIGVLHHLPKPALGLKTILKCIKPKGAISFWVYGKEGNYALRILNPLRKYFFSKIPITITKFASLLITSVVYPFSLIVYKPLKQINPPKWFTAMLPQWHFLNYLTLFNFRIAYSIIFDQLLAPVAFYNTKKEIKNWIEDTTIQDVIITSRNHNSWRIFGIKK